MKFYDYHVRCSAGHPSYKRYAHLLCIHFILVPATQLLPALQSLQLYDDLFYCLDDRALRRHTHSIHPQYLAF